MRPVRVTAHAIRQSYPDAGYATWHPLCSREPDVPAFDIAACASLMDELTALSARAALVIRDWSGAGIRTKADGSPVTAADEAAEAVIRDGLARLAPDVPIVSEEHAAREKPNIPTGPGASYFLVDPLDGTREFIAGRDEYTVNIAVIGAGVPLLGIITAPALGLTWRGIVGRGAERIATAGAASRATEIHTRPRPARERRHRGQPLASRGAHARLCRSLSAGNACAMRLLGKILSRRRRLGRSLSAAGADAGLGCRGRSRHCQSGRRRRHRARRIAAPLRNE